MDPNSLHIRSYPQEESTEIKLHQRGRKWSEANDMLILSELFDFLPGEKITPERGKFKTHQDSVNMGAGRVAVVIVS